MAPGEAPSAARRAWLLGAGGAAAAAVAGGAATWAWLSGQRAPGAEAPAPAARSVAPSAAAPAVSATAAAHSASSAAVQPLQRRSALVIGNGAYRQAPLKNPARDAKAMAEVLEQLGFEVTLRKDTTLRELTESLREFSVRAASSSVRLLYYAGHGVQAKGRNYLLPVDALPQGEDELPMQASDVGELVDRLGELPGGRNIVILDACRVNPFAGGVIVAPDGRRLKFRGTPKPGLAAQYAPSETLVAYSTAPNGVALDGAGHEHSVYARHLLAHIRTPGLPVEQLFATVGRAVQEETRGLQRAWYHSNMLGAFCLRADGQHRCG